MKLQQRVPDAAKTGALTDSTAITVWLELNSERLHTLPVPEYPAQEFFQEECRIADVNPLSIYRKDNLASRLSCHLSHQC